MDIKQLSYFLHVAELGSFTRAASLLNIAQPALSRQVRQLEVELRQTLLIRNGRGVSVTEAGKRLLEHTRGILYQVDRVHEDLEEMRGAPVGRTLIGLPPSLGRNFTVALVEDFKRHYPKASLAVIEGMSTYVQECVTLGRIEVGVVYNPMPSALLETTPLFSEPLYLIGPALAKSGKPQIGEPVRLNDLPRYDLIMPSRPHALRMFVETQLAKAGARARVVWEVDGIPGILSLVARGHGHTVLSMNAVRNDPLSHALLSRPIVEPRLLTMLALAISSQRPLTPLAKKVTDLVKALAPVELLKTDQQAVGEPNTVAAPDARRPGPEPGIRMQGTR
ncbi:MAG: nitrogen assimilation control protein [Noviherbaspirillum sp.]|nr:nitrogen assimilation control protein [Noviherbaspirillum sp.]